MKGSVSILLLALLAAPFASAIPPQQETKQLSPAWAYGVAQLAPAPHQLSPAASRPVVRDSSPRRVPGSPLSFTPAQIHDHFGPADWHTDDHNEMPAVVSHGRAPDVIACALCHYANGKGRSVNAALAGLPVNYFVQQIKDFKSGARASADPAKANTKTMIAIAKAMTDDELRSSAKYFFALPYTHWIKVVEAGSVPKTRIARGMFIPLEDGSTEPLGNRILEVPENAQATALHDDHSGFIAYVPAGSVARGQTLVHDDKGGSTVQCGVCHGDNLQGSGPVPPLAGRSPSYIARQIYDIQIGARNGMGSPLMITMQEAVAALSPDDIVAISAYIASLPPPAAAKAENQAVPRK